MIIPYPPVIGSLNKKFFGGKYVKRENEIKIIKNKTIDNIWKCFPKFSFLVKNLYAINSQRKIESIKIKISHIKEWYPNKIL